jgi:hypothetical protein
VKRVPCSYAGCGDRRSHYENPEPRGKPLMVEVSDDHAGPAYCSFECAIYDGAYSIRTGWITKDEKPATINIDTATKQEMYMSHTVQVSAEELEGYRSRFKRLLAFWTAMAIIVALLIAMILAVARPLATAALSCLPAFFSLGLAIRGIVANARGLRIIREIRERGEGRP